MQCITSDVCSCAQKMWNLRGWLVCGIHDRLLRNLGHLHKCLDIHVMKHRARVGVPTTSNFPPRLRDVPWVGVELGDTESYHSKLS
jgi:hypothetical protein